MRSNVIPANTQEIVHSIIASGAYKPTSQEPEEVAEEMAKFAFMVLKAVAKEYRVAEQEHLSQQQGR